ATRRLFANPSCLPSYHPPHWPGSIWSGPPLLPLACNRVYLYPRLDSTEGATMFVPSSAQLQAHYEKGYCSPNQQVLEDNYQKGRDHAAEGCVCHITMRGTWAVSYPTIISDWKGALYITSAGSGYDLVGDPNDVYGAALLQG